MSGFLSTNSKMRIHSSSVKHFCASVFSLFFKIFFPTRKSPKRFEMFMDVYFFSNLAYRIIPCNTVLTFPYSFHDIYELIEWICETDADHVLKQNKTYDTWQEGFLAIFHLLKKDEPFVVNIYHNAPRGYIYRYLYKVTYQLIYDVLEEKAAGMVVREEHKTFIADFYKYGFVGLVLEWIDKGMKEDPKKIIERLNALIQGSFTHALNNAKLNRS